MLPRLGVGTSQKHSTQGQPDVYLDGRATVDGGESPQATVQTPEVLVLPCGVAAVVTMWQLGERSTTRCVWRGMEASHKLAEQGAAGSRHLRNVPQTWSMGRERGILVWSATALRSGHMLLIQKSWLVLGKAVQEARHIASLWKPSGGIWRSMASDVATISKQLARAGERATSHLGHSVKKGSFSRILSECMSLFGKRP